MRFSRQGYGSGLPFPSPEHLPNPGIEFTSSVLQADSLPTELQVKCQKNIYFCFIDCTKAFDYVDHSKLWKILQEMGIPGHLTCPLRSLYAVQEATVRTGYGTWTGFKLGKEYVKAVHFHPVYLTYMQSTSCEMWVCMNYRLESRWPGEISITSDMQMTRDPYGRK